jgi:hypothetical protein
LGCKRRTIAVRVVSPPLAIRNFSDSGSQIMKASVITPPNRKID